MQVCLLFLGFFLTFSMWILGFDELSFFAVLWLALFLPVFGVFWVVTVQVADIITAYYSLFKLLSTLFFRSISLCCKPLWGVVVQRLIKKFFKF